MRNRRVFGAIRKLPSKRYQASYLAPDKTRIVAPMTFKAKIDADAWLATEQALLVNQTWKPPANRNAAASKVLFGAYAKKCIENRVTKKGTLLRPSTASKYLNQLKNGFQDFLDVPIADITAKDVRAWHAQILKTGKVTKASKAYVFLKSVMETAIEDGLIQNNPCKIRGAGKAKTGKLIEAPSPDDVARIFEAINPHFKVAALFAAYSGMRFGEWSELRWKDIELIDDPQTPYFKVNISRAVAEVDGDLVVGPPKSASGIRTLTLSSSLTTHLMTHLAKQENCGPETLIFQDSRGRQIKNYLFASAWKRALIATGLDGKGHNPHTLRHFSGTQMSLNGASVSELQAWLGDSSLDAVMSYLHTTGRERELAEKIVIPVRSHNSSQGQIKMSVSGGS